MYACVHARSGLTLCDSKDCSPPGSSVPGIPQARIPQWGVTSSSRGSSGPRDWTHVSWVSCRWILYQWANWEAPQYCISCCYLKVAVIWLLLEEVCMWFTSIMVTSACIQCGKLFLGISDASTGVGRAWGFSKAFSGKLICNQDQGPFLSPECLIHSLKVFAVFRTKGNHVLLFCKCSFHCRIFLFLFL